MCSEDITHVFLGHAASQSFVSAAQVTDTLDILLRTTRVYEQTHAVQKKTAETYGDFCSACARPNEMRLLTETTHCSRSTSIPEFSYCKNLQRRRKAVLTAGVAKKQECLSE